MAIFIFYLNCPDFISDLNEKEEVMQSKPNLHMLPKWEVISVPSLEQLRKKDCPNSWSARLSQSQDVDGQGLGYTSRHSGCNTTIQQFLCCILRRALTSLVLSYKPPPLAFNKDILHQPVCSQSSLAAGPLVKFWMTIPKFWPKPILRLLFRYQIFQNRKPQKNWQKFRNRNVNLCCQVLSQWLWGGVGQRTEYCDSNKNGGYSNLRLNSKPFRCCILSQARTMTWRLIRFIPVGQKRHLSLEVRAGSGDVRPRLVTTKQCHHQIMIAGPADQKQTHSSS